MFFTPDGIMFTGEFLPDRRNYSDGKSVFRWKRNCSGEENTLWANTVIASSNATGIVIYTGKETRAQKNNSEPQPKFGSIDLEINAISKALFIFMFLCAIAIVALSGFPGTIEVNIINIFRFLLLLSSIILL